MTETRARPAGDGQDLAPPIDEVDLQLVHALQVFPRATWADLARAVDHSPTTIAARWRRLETAGVAWVAVHPNPAAPGYVEAFVELAVEPTQRASLASRLASDPRLVSIDESSRGSDLILTVMVADLAALSTLVLDDLPALPGITGVRSSVIVSVETSGGDWRVGALDRDQVALVEAARRAGVDEAPAGRLPADVWPVLEALLAHPRLPFSELARVVGRPPATVRRHIGALLASDLLSLRCDVAHAALGLPLTTAFFTRVPVAQLARTMRILRTLAPLRMCVHTTGEHNLIFSVVSRSMQDLATLQEQVSRQLPWMKVAETHVLLRSAKRMGWLLDRAGRNTGELVVPTALRALVP